MRAACGPTPGCWRSCGASLRVIVSISRASSRSSAVSCRTRRAIERSASMLPRSSGSRRPSGRVAASRCSSRARVSGCSSLRNGSGVVISRSLEHDRAADHVHDRERVRVAVRIDTNHVVQLICEHPLTDLQPKRWGTHPVSVWGGNRGRQNCDGSRAHNADRLLIRPASGRQADTGSPLGHITGKTPKHRVIRESSHEQRARRQPDKRPRRDTHTLTVRE